MEMKFNIYFNTYNILKIFYNKFLKLNKYFNKIRLKSIHIV